MHPELNALSDYMSGEDVEGDGAWCGGSMTLREDASTMALEDGDGATRSREHAPPDRRPLRRGRRHGLYFALFPNALVSLHPDYVMLHTLWPRAAGRDRRHLRVVLRAGDDRRATDFDPSDAIDFWDQVNRRTGTCAS